MNTAQVIPFQFDTHEIRTLLIDDQPWFVAADVCKVLNIKNSRDALEKLDVDEKGVALTDTLGGQQEVSTVNESGLFTLILRCRNAVKSGTPQHRFRKWVTAEVLPAIRKHGRYDITSATIGTDGLHILHELIGKKIKVLPTKDQRSAKARLWGLVHTRFNVPKVEMIPADELANACNFVAACAVGGEWLLAQPEPITREQQLDALANRINDHIQQLPNAGTILNDATRHNLVVLCDHVIRLREICRRYGVFDALGKLGSPVGKEMYEHVIAGSCIAKGFKEDFGPGH